MFVRNIPGSEVATGALPWRVFCRLWAKGYLEEGETEGPRLSSFYTHTVLISAIAG